MSAALSEKGAPWEILRRWMAGGFALVVSLRLLHELQTVLAREKFRRHLTYEEATEYVSWLHHEAEVLKDQTDSFMVGVTATRTTIIWWVWPFSLGCLTSSPATLTCSAYRTVS